MKCLECDRVSKTLNINIKCDCWTDTDPYKEAQFKRWIQKQMDFLIDLENRDEITLIKPYKKSKNKK